jgi:hypothetical protein
MLKTIPSKKLPIFLKSVINQFLDYHCFEANYSFYFILNICSKILIVINKSVLHL